MDGFFIRKVQTELVLYLKWGVHVKQEFNSTVTAYTIVPKPTVADIGIKTVEF